MKKRIIWKMFLLEVVTLGIYRFYYLIKTRREMMHLNRDIKIITPAFLFIPLGIVLTAIIIFLATIISSPRPASQFCSNNGTQNITASDSTSPQSCSPPSAASIVSILVLYLAIFIAVILLVVWEWSYSQGVAVITGGKLSFAVTLIVLVLVPDGIDILIIQDYFNKLDTASTPPYTQTPSIPIPPPPLPAAE